MITTIYRHRKINVTAYIISCGDKPFSNNRIYAGLTWLGMSRHSVQSACDIWKAA